MFWITKKRHEKEINELKLQHEKEINELRIQLEYEKAQRQVDLHRHVTCLSMQRESYEREINNIIKPMVNEFASLTIVEDKNRNAYQVVVECDTNWVKNCFVHGNSDREIDYICMSITTSIVQKLKQMLQCRNFYRTERL